MTLSTHLKGQRVGYVGVSTLEQNTNRQLEGIELDKLYVDHASGKDTERPQLQEMLRYVREGDTVVVHSMDRLARNVDDLRRLVRDLNVRGVRMEFVKEHLLLSGEASPIANMMLSILGAIGQFERELIRQRQIEGIALAKKRGLYKGRKRVLTPEQVETLKARVAAGESRSALARECGIGRKTLYNYLRMKTEPRYL